MSPLGEALSQQTFQFANRPYPLPPELRPIWRIILILLSLRICGRSNTASLRKMYVINWWLRSEPFRKAVGPILEGQGGRGEAVMHFEPSFTRALDFAAAENLINFSAGRNVGLTISGAELAQQLMGLIDLQGEISTLQLLGKRLTENGVAKIYDSGEDLWALE